MSDDEIMRYSRVWLLDDIEIVRSGQGGDGRTVSAYAAVFGSPTEIQDQHGHYMEQIHRSAFNRALSHGIARVAVLYNHGAHLDGSPSALGSVPIGSPVDIRADGKGLLTVTRYNRSQLADAVLEAIRAGDIRGYSFRGRVFQSDPPRLPRATRGGSLPTITRMELGLSEYGPTPIPFYAEAGIIAVRSGIPDAAEHLRRVLPDTDLAELVRAMSAATPLSTVDPESAANATPEVSGLGAEGSPTGAPLPALSQSDIARRIRVARILRGM